MRGHSLDVFAEAVRSAWGPVSSDLVAACRARIEELVRAAGPEDWLAELRRDLPESRELFRDPAHGFVLLAHAEAQGRSRPPHDHGRGWVIYAVQQGEMEVKTYARLHDADRGIKLVERDACRLRPGESRVYLPGDIHDTRCTEGPVLYYRFTDRDLWDAQEQQRVTRYANRDGIWSLGAA